MFFSSTWAGAGPGIAIDRSNPTLAGDVAVIGWFRHYGCFEGIIVTRFVLDARRVPG